MAARQTDAEQAAMAARRIGGASPGCERVSATFRTPQGSACCEPVFRPLAARQHLLRAGSVASPACRNLALSRSRFDSGKARQTVRQSRFRGLEFASVFVAKRAMAARQTNAEQAAMAARRIGSASPGCERVSATFRTPQGSACCEPVFRHSPHASVCCGRVRLLCPRAGIWLFFAPDLIAAKPVKSCDRAVFQALNLLPFLQ